MRIVILPKAEKRLDEIYNFIKINYPKAAADICNDILDEIEFLKNFPKMAAVEPILAGCTEIFRSLVVRRHYKVIYYIEDETIYIVTIWDCRQDPKRLWNEVVIE
ncbi:hypothetical protein FACS189440_05640 [Bacteroidia bacterium]|nr:hypothetical protein FACS189423_01550 [Bacteroidia bacterium]GHT46804.1 hypothetical protein FACS189440_05640 [Bacteroidia bacterium]